MEFRNLQEGKTYKGENFGGTYKLVKGGLWSINVGEYSEMSMRSIMDVNFYEIKQFTEDELKVLNLLKEDFQWVAKDLDGNIWAFSSEPWKEQTYWSVDGFDIVDLCFFNMKFDCLSFNDEKATKWR